MHFKPQNACETQYFNQAFSEIEMLMKDHPMYADLLKRYNGKPPRWMQSAIKQHALFYAREMCAGRG